MSERVGESIEKPEKPKPETIRKFSDTVLRLVDAIPKDAFQIQTGDYGDAIELYIGDTQIAHIFHSKGQMPADFDAELEDRANIIAASIEIEFKDQYENLDVVRFPVEARTHYELMADGSMEKRYETSLDRRRFSRAEQEALGILNHLDFASSKVRSAINAWLSKNDLQRLKQKPLTDKELNDLCIFLETYFPENQDKK